MSKAPNYGEPVGGSGFDKEPAFIAGLANRKTSPR